MRPITKDVVTAQAIMGTAGGISCDMQRRPVSRYWTEEECYARFRPADVWEWVGRIVALECHGLAGFSMFVAPEIEDEYGNVHVIPGWCDMPGEELGEMTVEAAGILELARWYRGGRHE